MASIPTRVRDALLIEADFRCCVCQEPHFLDVHHLTPRSKGGADTPANLVVLCPTCHRKADRGVLSRRQLLLLAKRHKQLVADAVRARDAFSRAQELQVSRFVHENCIARPYDHDALLQRDQTEIFLLSSGLRTAAMVVHPETGRPLLVGEEALPALSALEVVTDPFRFIFLHDAEEAVGGQAERLMLIRADVGWAAAEVVDASPTDPAVAAYRDDLHRLFQSSITGGGREAAGGQTPGHR